MRETFISFFYLFFTFSLFSQSYVLPLWDIGNDNFVKKRKFLFNTTFSSRYNFNNKVQIASQLPLFLLFPNLQAKLRLWDHYEILENKSFLKKYRFGLTSAHTLVIPFYGMNFLGQKGLLLTPQPHIPFNITFNNELLLSIFLNYNKVCNYTGNKLTLKFGLRNSFGIDTNIVLPKTAFWYLNTSIFKYGYFYYFGLNYDAKILNNLNLSISAKWLKIHNNIQFLENYTLLYFGFGYKKRSTIAVGYIANIMANTFQYSILPVFNLGYFFNKQKGSDIDKYLKY